MTWCQALNGILASGGGQFDVARSSTRRSLISCRLLAARPTVAGLKSTIDDLAIDDLWID
jgi:hypothetical protein